MKKNIFKSLLFFCPILLLLLNGNINAATVTSAQTGLFSVGSTWVGGVAPVTGDNIIISTGNTVTLDMYPTVMNITIQTGAILDNGIYTLTIGQNDPGGNPVYTNNGVHNGPGDLIAYDNWQTTITGNGILNCNFVIRSYGLSMNANCNLTINGNIQHAAPGNSGISNKTFLDCFELGGALTINGDILTDELYMVGILIVAESTLTVNGNVSLSGGLETGSGSNITNSGTINISGDLMLGPYSGFCQNSGNMIIGGDLLGGGIGGTYFLQEINAMVTFGGQVFPETHEGELMVSGIGLISGQSIEPNTVEYNGTSAQMIALPSSGQPYSNLTINNSGSGVSLNSEITVNGILSLNDGIVNLGSNNLILAENAAISGTIIADNMIVATGTGELRKIFTSPGSFTFPVGDNDGTAEYSPVSLNFSAGTYNNAFVGVSLVNASYPGVTGSYLNRYWNITSSGIIDMQCDAQFNYVPADVTGIESNLYCFRVAPIVDEYNQANSTLHQLTANGLTSFGTFTGREQDNLAYPTAFTVIGGGSYCEGEDGLPVGLSGSQTDVTYTLFKDDVAQVPTIAGTGDAISFGNQVFGTYTVSGTNANGTSVMNGIAVITETTTLPVSVSLSTDLNNVCAGTLVTLTATPVNGGTPTYQWYKNAALAGSNQSTYTYAPENNDQVYVVITSDLACVSGNPAASNTVVLTVNELLPVSVGVVADVNNVCAGTEVTLTANPVNGGNPTYQWFENAAPVGSNQATYTYIPENNDQVFVVMTSDLACVSGNPATSNTVTMFVTEPLLPSVTITASENPFTAGTMVTFTPSPVNGGTPIYEWFVNSNPVGNGDTYSYIPENGDQVYVIMTSSLVCVTTASVSSNTIIMTENPVVPASSTWIGAVNSDWFNPGNWGNGVPGTITMVNIPGGLVNYPTLVAPATIAGITINNGGSFIGSEFLITGSALVKRDIVNADYHFISSPVINTTFGDVFPLEQTQLLVREYNETTGDWDNLTIADALTVGKGYSVQLTLPQTALFEGVLNSSPVTMTLAKQNPGTDPQSIGWNLLGNPFTSAIDWDLIDHANVDGAVYEWNGSQYLSWNGSVGALTEGIIPAQNGFFAKTVTDGVTINVPLSARVHSTQGFYKTSVPDMLEITVEGNSFSDKTFVHFNNMASSDFDSQFDAYKLFGNANAPQIYSLINNDTYLSINELPMAGNEVVDMGFSSNSSGIYSITAAGTENFASNIPVVLQDVKLNTYQNLKQNPVYSFSYEAGEDENRFKLWFQQVTGINTPNSSDLKVYSFAQIVVIENPKGQTGQVGIYDLTGRVIATRLIKGETTSQIRMDVAGGTYLVRILTSEGPVNTKVFIR